MAFDIQGPAGRLEALLDDPAFNCHIGPVRRETAGEVRHRRLSRRAAPRGRRARAPAADRRRHDAQQGRVPDRKGFCRIGAPVLRFNFRGVGTSEGAFEDGPGEMADYRAALDFMAARYPGAELWAAGFSFGAWVAMTVGAMDDRVTTLIGVAPPVDRYDFSAVLESLKPKFFIQGDRDDLCPYPSMRAFYANVPGPKEMVTIDGADHLFDGKTSEVAEAVEELLGTSRGWDRAWDRESGSGSGGSRLSALEDGRQQAE